ncbi:MADS-box transcription factor 16 isoform X2 [Canna indica]|uniref:MADS-box transcription factor 16 isoform X2 n=1 Tax=Canna indica TaxID=4628 RepID=A0AAQ3QSQ3_9LILI|nr:MADS-box transcription factor 16 isoform X2 [Canna indica]
MQNYLNHLKQINTNLRKEISQRLGEDLDGLDIDELRGLEQNMDEALKEVRERKYHLISTQTETYKKKLKSAQEGQRKLLQDLVIKDEESAYGFADDGLSSSEGALVLANGGSQLYAIRVQPNQPNLQGISYRSYDLRLA